MPVYVKYVAFAYALVYTPVMITTAAEYQEICAQLEALKLLGAEARLLGGRARDAGLRHPEIADAMADFVGGLNDALASPLLAAETIGAEADRWESAA